MEGQLVTFPRDKLHPPACPPSLQAAVAGFSFIETMAPSTCCVADSMLWLFIIIATESRPHPLCWENVLQSSKSSGAHAFRVSGPGATQLGSSRAWLEPRSLPKHSGARILFLLADSQIRVYYRTTSHNLKVPGDFQLQQHGRLEA